MTICICELCGDAFESGRSDSKYCPAHRSEGHNISNKRYRQRQNRLKRLAEQGISVDIETVVELAGKAGMSYGKYVARMDGYTAE